MNKLAIVIPFYKISFFEDTLKSLSNQTDKRFTLYIGNDASKDNPTFLLDKYLDGLEYEYFLYDVNVGGADLVGQWERILSNVKEEWFQILGDDDYVSNNFVSAFYEYLPKFNDKVNVVKTYNVKVDDEGNLIRDDFKGFKSGFYSAYDHLISKFLGTSYLSLSEHVFRKNSFDKIGFVRYPLAWHTDDMLVLQMSDMQYYYYIDSCCVYVRLSMENISGSDRYFDLKAKASELFFVDFLILVDRAKNNVFRRKIEVFRIIRRFHTFYGIDVANRLIRDDSILGKLYVSFANLKEGFRN